MQTQTAKQNHLIYRRDIDGLRAVAVLSVVGFHAFPSSIKSGFIGVDIFFVISGYLISGIIFTSLQNNTFTFAEFYGRRIRRIFPALLLVLSFNFVTGWFWLLADEFQQLGKHIASGAGFMYNFVLWGEAGYFDGSSEEKPLLHLWSLSIEEQFYLLWPFFAWVVWKVKVNPLRPIFVMAAISLWLSMNSATITISHFYSPVSRFWELLAGSFLAYSGLTNPQTRSSKNASETAPSVQYLSQIFSTSHIYLQNVFSFIGLLLLSFGYLTISKSSDFPGSLALFPVVGVVLIIAAGPSAWINRVILSNRLLVWIGLISFPLYLWHWSLLSFALIIAGEAQPIPMRTVLVLLSFALAWLTYAFVEKPIRFRQKRQLNIALLIFGLAVVGLAGGIVYLQNGFPQRPIAKKFETFTASMKSTERAKECFDIPYAYSKPNGWRCRLGKPDALPQYFVSGDSHALSLLPVFEKLAIEKNVAMDFTGTSGCPPLLEIQSMRGEKSIEKFNCRRLNERIFDHVKMSDIQNVVLVARWVYYTGSKSRPAEFNAVARNEAEKVSKVISAVDLAWAMRRTVERYREIGVNVIFVADIPQQHKNPKDILRKGNGDENIYNGWSVTLDEHLKNQEIANRFLSSNNTKILSFDNVLCSNKTCPLVYNSRFIYSDDDHLSVFGSLFLYDALEKQLF